MLSSSPSNAPHDCARLVEIITEHGRRIGDNTADIKALNVKYDSIMNAVAEAKESQDKTCEAMAQIGIQLTSKLETMSNTQHAMQLEAKELSTTFKLDRENQSTKKTDNRWLFGVAISLITAANILIPWFRN
jgi:hypothetical protein